ncbi:MAG: caspase family protein [Pseudomonadota bacterium]
MKLTSLLGTFLAICLVFAASTSLAGKRNALVIGNSQYAHASPLANPVNDAQAMTAKLESLGFNVVSGYDLDYIGMNQVVREFSRIARQSEVNILFYAGHGMAVDGINYLIPIDARLEDSTALDFEAVPVDFVTRQMSYSDSANLVFLDACRDNPLSKSLSRSMGGATRALSINDGLAEMRTPPTGKGLAIAFATSPGEVALDGDGVNSPFTTSLLRHIGSENTDISVVLSRVVADVWQDTEEQQRPWLSSSLTGSVMLNAVPVSLHASNVSAQSLSAVPVEKDTSDLDSQKLLFSMARDSGLTEDYQAYLDTFPTGLFANNARRAIARLNTAGQQQASIAPSTNAPAVSSRTSIPNASSGPQIDEYGALVLNVSQRVRAMHANENTELLLDLDRQKRGEIQSRLNAAGSPVGVVDGLWGRKTRAGISTWQVQNGLAGSGFLNQVQLELLTSQTEGRYQPFVAPAPSKVRTSSSGAKRNSSPQRSSQKSRNTNADAAVGAFMGALVGTIVKNR